MQLNQSSTAAADIYCSVRGGYSEADELFLPSTARMPGPSLCASQCRGREKGGYVRLAS